MSLPGERQEALRAVLMEIDDPQERLAIATGWKNTLRTLDPALKTEEHRVPGCVSRVWLAAAMEEGRCRFSADAESPLVRGLVTLLCGFYDGATPAEVLAEEPAVLEECGLARNLSPTRRNGLAAIRNALVEFARAQQ